VSKSPPLQKGSKNPPPKPHRIRAESHRSGCSTTCGLRNRSASKGTHFEDIIRMNILLGEIVGWCELNHVKKDAVPVDKFEWIMGLVQSAASNPVQDSVWNAQGAFLKTQDGETYLKEIYTRRVNLRAKMEPNHWRLASVWGCLPQTFRVNSDRGHRWNSCSEKYR
jgi:hypothetical protein